MTYDRIKVGEAFDKFVRTIAPEFGRTLEQTADFLNGCGDYYEGELIAQWAGVMEYLLMFLTDEDMETYRDVLEAHKNVLKSDITPSEE